MILPNPSKEFRATLAYVVFAGLWVFASDWLLLVLVSEPSLYTRLQTLKGWGFVLLSALWIYVLVLDGLRLRRQAEQGLRRSEERFRQLFDRSLDAILLTSPDGSVHAANAAACRLFGRSEAEIRAAGRSGLADARDPRLALALRERSQGGTFSGVLTFLRADGSTFEGELSASPFLDEDNGPRSTLIIRDISERIRAEEALRESERRYRLMFEHNPQPMWVYDQQTLRFLAVNAAAVAHYGYALEEFLAMTIKDIRPAEDVPALLGNVAAAQSGLGKSGVWRHRLKDGRIAEVEISSHDLEFAGRPARLVMMNDVTEARRAEERLRASERLLRLFVENSPAAIAMFDREMRYVAVSRRFLEDYQLEGLSPQDIEGRSHYELFPEISEGWREVHRRCQAGATERGEAEPFRRADGRLDWVSWEICPWYADGQIGGVILFSEVITQRKRAEALLEQRYKELSVIYESAQRLQTLIPPERLAKEVIEVLEETLQYSYSAVLLLDPAEGTLHPFALSDQQRGPEFVEEDKALIRTRKLGLGVGITGWVAQHGRTVRLGDVRSDPRYLFMRDDIRSELCVPLKVQDRVIGVINIETARPDAYGPDDQRVLETVASQISVAIENARLLDSVRGQARQLRELAQRLTEAESAERRNLARELHDHVGQLLTALNINLSLVRQELERCPPEIQARLGERLRDSLELVEETSRAVRDVMTSMYPPVLADYGLAAALRWYAGPFTRRTGIEVEVRGADGPRLAPYLEAALFRVAQEALTNVARHSGARRVALELSVGDSARLTLEDDGQGFDPNGPRQADERGGWGLRTMGERLEAVGGRFRLDSAPGRGTRLEAEVPLSSEAPR